MKHRREKREHGRILSVETKVRGDVLLETASAGATQLVVSDAGDFDEDGGWLVINDQVVRYVDVDDDEGLINLAEGLTVAADAGDQVGLWSKLYDQIVDYQEAEVVLDGEHDNPEAIVAEVAEGVGDLPEGDRGEAGESCTLLRVSDDEWEIVGVGGRPRKLRGIQFEDGDIHVVTADDVIADSITFSLSQTPIPESVHMRWNGVPVEPSEFTVDGKTVAVSDPEHVLLVGDRLWFMYAYERGVQAPSAAPKGSWAYLQVPSSDTTDRSGVGFDDSAWETGEGPFGSGTGVGGYAPAFGTAWTTNTVLWIRRRLPAASSYSITVDIDNTAEVFWNGITIASPALNYALPEPSKGPFLVSGSQIVADNVLAVRAKDVGGLAYLDVKVVEQ